MVQHIAPEPARLEAVEAVGQGCAGPHGVEHGVDDLVAEPVHAVARRVGTIEPSAPVFALLPFDERVQDEREVLDLGVQGGGEGSGGGLPSGGVRSGVQTQRGADRHRPMLSRNTQCMHPPIVPADPFHPLDCRLLCQLSLRRIGQQMTANRAHRTQPRRIRRTARSSE